ncbi:MAG: cadherin domain-containing protein, partial [Vampirovibrionales bacterium]
AINSTTGVVTVANSSLLDFETNTTHSITVRVTDAGGLTRDLTQAITVTNVNEAPNALTLASGGSIAENSANGTTVATFAGTDPDTGDSATLTYSLTDNAGGRFAINSSTGVVTVANSSLLDFETNTTHNITVRVTDAGGLTRDLTQAITVTNQNETPYSLTGSGTVQENSANGTVVGTFTGLDYDNPDTLTYTLTDNAGGRFAINSTTGVVTVADSSLLDFESATTHNITVRVTDAGGLTRDLTQAITVTNVNEAPNGLFTFTTGADLITNGSFESYGTGWTTSGNVGFSGSQGTFQGSLAALFSGGDSANNGIISQNIATTNGSSYRLDFRYGAFGYAGAPQALRVQVISNGTTVINQVLNTNAITSWSASWLQQTLNFTALGTTTQVIFSDASSVTNGVDLLLDAISVRELIPTTPTVLTLLENSANGTTVATFAGTDPDTGDSATLTYSLTNNAGGRFAINSSTGIVTVANSSLLDFETNTTHNITVRVTDAGGLTRDLTQAITVTNVNEAPNALTLASGGSIAENSVISGFNTQGVVVGTFSASDLDAGSSLTYSLVTNPNNRFYIDPSTGVLTVSGFDVLNFETNPTYNITVRVTDQFGLFRDLNQTISLTDVNEAPYLTQAGISYLSDLTPSAVSGLESNPISSITNDQGYSSSILMNGVNYSKGIGTHPVNGGAWGGASYAIGGADVFRAIVGGNRGNGSFTVRVLVDGVVQYTSTLITGSTTPFEVVVPTNGGTTLRLEVNDGGNSNASDHAVWADARLVTYPSLAENSANGTAVTTFAGVDPDAGQTAGLTYTLTDNAGGRFAINSTTGVVTVANSSLLDFESA